MGIRDRTVSVQMPFGTDLTKLTANFVTNASTVWLGDKEQESGVTENDFSSDRVYRLEAANGDYNFWTVHVTTLEPGGPDYSLKFTSFEISGGKILGAVDNTIYAAVQRTTDLTDIVATFETNADRVLVGNAEQVSGTTSNDFSNGLTYRLEAESGYNDITVKAYKYDLPVVYINVPVSVSLITKDDWVDGTAISIFDSQSGELTLLGVEKDATDVAVNQIKGRGNTTWGYPKKPYTIKANKKTEVLGMPKEKRWNLLANWCDRTGIRNDITFQLGRVSPGLAWTPRGKFVELILNGEHAGNYYLCEHVAITKNRVNITAYDEDAPAAPEEIGYLFEFDTYFDEVNKFKSSLELPVNVKDPDVEGFDLTYVKGWINNLESKLQGSVSTNDYKDYLDIDSFIDWWLVQEMVGNWEPNHPKSSYMYKDSSLADDNKIHAGPLWDFDYATFLPGRTSSWVIQNAMWYKYLFKDPAFKARLKEKWAAQKPLYDEVASTYLNALKTSVKASIEKDKKKWPCTDNVNGDEKMSFDDAVNRLQNSLKNKISWMNTAINSL